MEGLDPTKLPDFTEMKTQASWNYTLRNYIESRGSTELAVAFANLFWPDLVEQRGCVLRVDGFDADNFEAWWLRTNGDRLLIERSLNGLHLGDLVPSEAPKLDPDVLRYLGDRIAQMWQSRASQLFPDRRFVGAYESGDEDDGEPTVYLYQAP